MDNKNMVKKHFESFFQELDESSKKSPLPARTLWSRLSFKSKTSEASILEKLQCIWEYIQKLEETISQQEETIIIRNKDTENLKGELQSVIKESSNLKVSFNRKKSSYTKVLKEKDENLEKLTGRMQNLQDQIDDIRKFHTNNTKTENRFLPEMPNLSVMLNEFKEMQLEGIVVKFKEFEQNLSDTWLSQMETFESRVKAAVKDVQEATTEKDTSEHLKKPCKKYNNNYKSRGSDKEEAD